MVQGLEVTLRNAIHGLLSKELGSDTWYNTVALGRPARAGVEYAKEKVVERGAVLLSGRVVAELKFGFWVKLFSHSYDKPLWVPHLRKLFPWRLDGKRSFVHGRLMELKTLRNRIAHHERISRGRRDVRQDYSDILETIGWISPDIRRWVASINGCEERFTRPLPKKSKPLLAAQASQL